MTEIAAIALAAAVVVALVHWYAVAVANRRLLKITKPVVMVLLIVAALTLSPESQSMRNWFVAGLIFSLAGDVFLMLDREQFIAGLASFLIAHLAYIAGLATRFSSPLAAGMSAIVALGLIAVIGRRIHAGARDRDRRLGVPVAAYIIVITAMVVAAAATSLPLAIAGAVAFYASDAILGWNRFVEAIPHGRLLTMVTYHLAQVLLTLSLV